MQTTIRHRRISVHGHTGSLSVHRLQSTSTCLMQLRLWNQRTELKCVFVDRFHWKWQVALRFSVRLGDGSPPVNCHIRTSRIKLPNILANNVHCTYSINRSWVMTHDVSMRQRKKSSDFFRLVKSWASFLFWSAKTWYIKNDFSFFVTSDSIIPDSSRVANRVQ